MAEHLKTRILVIEDDADTREVLAYVLEHEGFSVAAAADGERGLELTHSWRPDVVLLDLLMPRLGGHEVARVLQADPALCDIPVVTISASPAQHRPPHASAHIQKPFGIREVLDAVALAISGACDGGVAAPS